MENVLNVVKSQLFPRFSMPNWHTIPRCCAQVEIPRLRNPEGAACIPVVTCIARLPHLLTGTRHSIKGFPNVRLYGCEGMCSCLGLVETCGCIEESGFASRWFTLDYIAA